MRKHYIDNIRSLTVILVVCYHIVYLFNGIVQDGVIGSLTDWHGMDVVTDLLAGYALPLAGAAGVLGVLYCMYFTIYPYQPVLTV